MTEPYHARAGDAPLAVAAAVVVAARSGNMPCPEVHSFLDQPTSAVCHLVVDPVTRCAAVIDSVLDFDPVGTTVGRALVDRVLEHVRLNELIVEWALETHLHADHMSAARLLRREFGCRIGLPDAVVAASRLFGAEFSCSGIDHLFKDGDRLAVGTIGGVALGVPGHTPADMAFVLGDAVFSGDLLFMPDHGTARTDFPGGDARQLYRSARRLLALPAETRMFVGHDYGAPGRPELAWETRVAAQRRCNIHVGNGRGEDAFVDLRTKRDATLPLPQRYWPSLLANLRLAAADVPHLATAQNILTQLEAIERTGAGPRSAPCASEGH